MHPAYMAGLLDGEGCVRLSRGVPVITVTNTYRPLLEQLKAAFGGTVSTTGRPAPGHKLGWRWSIEGRRAVAIVRLAYPWLRIKARQADALLWGASVADGKMPGPVADFLHGRITWLNRRGSAERN